MRIIIDSNVLLSATVFKGAKITELMRIVIDDHTLILTNNILNEVRKVIEIKKPEKLPDFEKFLSLAKFEHHFTSNEGIDTTIQIRDPNDIIIISDAIAVRADILITGDNDFFDRTYDGLEIIKPADFIKKYGQ
ncbi:MAG: putative toxin-antitoxin system toxin component, PIN family [Clostridiales bacterium]|jgi:putative PIN family toxin of toxin-antitoxin system|nr:putative toxin-antitoxin system toxin component, PIN family [Clostridiales bacterium]